MTECNCPGHTGYRGSTVLLAVLGGAAAGAAVALLTAPKSGREMRAQISEKVRDTRDQVTDTLKNGREKVRHLPGAVKVAGAAARDAFVDAMDVSV